MSLRRELYKDTTKHGTTHLTTICAAVSRISTLISFNYTFHLPRINKMLKAMHFFFGIKTRQFRNWLSELNRNLHPFVFVTFLAHYLIIKYDRRWRKISSYWYFSVLKAETFRKHLYTDCTDKFLNKVRSLRCICECLKRFYLNPKCLRHLFAPFRPVHVHAAKNLLQINKKTNADEFSTKWRVSGRHSNPRKCAQIDVRTVNYPTKRQNLHKTNYEC